MTRTPTNGSAVYWPCDRRRHVTSILHCHWGEFRSHDLSFRFLKFYIFDYFYKFDTVLYQFLEASNITLMGLNQLLRYLGFTLYPLLFFHYIPFKFKHFFKEFHLICWICDASKGLYMVFSNVHVGMYT